MAAVVCPYCYRDAELVTGERLYPNRPDLWGKSFHLCEPCWAYVGCHPGSTKPLGRLANAELRTLKQAAHSAFDRRWKGPQAFQTRTEAYAWLAKQLRLEPSACHIGMFDAATCLRVVEVCR